MRMTLYLVCCLLSAGLCAEDVTQWRGTGRDGVYPETGLLKAWPESGPPLLWKTAGLGGGYSSPTVVGDRVYLTGVKREEGVSVEALTCLNTRGEILWETPYSGVEYKGPYPNVRTTPTWRDGELYVITRSGEIAKLDGATGKLLWRTNAKYRCEGQNGEWGTAESPLVDARAVYFTAGGSETTFVAYSRKTGKLIWKSRSLEDVASYVSPTLFQREHSRQILGATTNFLFGVDPENGEILWNVDLREELDGGRRIQRWGIIANSLVCVDGRILMSNGYSHGALLLELDAAGTRANVVWKNLDLTSMHHGFVVLDGVIYSTAHNSQRFTTVDLASGRTLFHDKIGNLGLAQIITADGLLYLYDSARGNVILAKPSPEKGFEEISRFQIRDGAGEHWCHPVISGKTLYLRHGDVLLAFDLRERP